MKKIIVSFMLCLISFGAGAATNAAANYMDASAYQNLYPYMNNKMRVRLNPGVDTTNSQDTISTLTRTNNAINGRRVVARSATNSGAYYPADANTQYVSRSGITPTQTRRVVARRGSDGNETVSRASRLDSSYVYKVASAAAADASSSTTQSISTNRCLADYVTCMNGYCERDKTNYNRCYCSSKLAQIDATYQPEIDYLIKQIIMLKNTGTYTDAEMQQYWQEKVGQYTGDNSWTKLDSALDIDWSDTESRVRGQQAFLTGHEYCMQNLQGCYYMAANMRDAYISEINRDCAKYQTNLQKVKEAAESIVENLSD